MKKNALTSGIIILSVLFLIAIENAYSAEPVMISTEPQQKLDAHFRMFRTENMWTHLLLDTKDGRVWQVQISTKEDVQRTKIPINLKPLIKNASKDGRFTLYPTANMWNFLLIDQEDGRLWQVQFSTTEGERLILPVEEYKGKELSKINPLPKKHFTLDEVEESKKYFRELLKDSPVSDTVPSPAPIPTVDDLKNLKEKK